MGLGFQAGAFSWKGPAEPQEMVCEGSAGSLASVMVCECRPTGYGGLAGGTGGAETVIAGGLWGHGGRAGVLLPSLREDQQSDHPLRQVLRASQRVSAVLLGSPGCCPVLPILWEQWGVPGALLTPSYCRYAYIEFEEQSSMKAAMMLNNSLFRGRVIKVSSILGCCMHFSQFRMHGAVLNVSTGLATFCLPGAAQKDQRARHQHHQPWQLPRPLPSLQRAGPVGILLWKAVHRRTREGIWVSGQMEEFLCIRAKTPGGSCPLFWSCSASWNGWKEKGSGRRPVLETSPAHRAL